MLFLAALMLVPQGFANTVYLTKPDPHNRRSPYCSPNNLVYDPSCRRTRQYKGSPCSPNSRAYDPSCRRGPPTHL